MNGYIYQIEIGNLFYIFNDKNYIDLDKEKLSNNDKYTLKFLIKKKYLSKKTIL